MKRPSVDEMNLAAEWLDAYEDDEGGAAMCHVATWLREQADAAHLRVVAKINRVPVALLRKKLRSGETKL
jgi:hypothetical protein